MAGEAFGVTQESQERYRQLEKQSQAAEDYKNLAKVYREFKRLERLSKEENDASN